MPSRRTNLSSFNNAGTAAGVRRGHEHIRRLLARDPVTARVPSDKIALKPCLCGKGHCNPNCVICNACWNCAPTQAKKDVYSRQFDVRRAAVRVLTEHALDRNSNPPTPQA